MPVRIVTNRSSLAGSAARDAEARKASETQALPSSGMGFSMQGQGGRPLSTPAAGLSAVANQSFSGPHGGNDGPNPPGPVLQRAAYPKQTQQPGEVTSTVERFRQKISAWFK